ILGWSPAGTGYWSCCTAITARRVCQFHARAAVPACVPSGMPGTPNTSFPFIPLALLLLSFVFPCMVQHESTCENFWRCSPRTRVSCPPAFVRWTNPTSPCARSGNIWEPECVYHHGSCPLFSVYFGDNNTPRRGDARG
ncbi:unnamed protein product, partial [Ectocarpus sp. 12 AP-2014]